MMNKNICIITLAFTLLLVPQIAESFTYCVNDTLIENITVGQTVITLPDNCPFGCYDNITASGSACGSPDIYNVSLAFGLIMSFIFIIFTLPKLLRRKKKGR